MLQLFTRIMDGLDVFPDRMLANLNMTRGLVFSERVLLALVQTGMVRNEAYLIVQEAAKRVWAGESDLRTVLASDRRVTDWLTDAQLDDCFKLEHHMQGIDVPFQRLGLLPANVPATVG
jgi:adenylosuccinate lyase